MHVFLDTTDRNLVGRVQTSLSTKYSDVIVNNGITQIGLGPTPSKADSTVNLYYSDGLFNHLDKAQSRLAQYAFATEGAILFTDKDVKDKCPIYAGKLPTGVEDRVLVHLDYSKKRVAKFKDQPVKYFGATLEDPKNVLVLDNKKPEKNLPTILSVLEHAPDNWWASIGFVTTGNAQHLDEFFNEELYYSSAVAMTPASVAKLRSAKVQLLDATNIDLSVPRGGVLLRELTRRNDTWGFTIEVD